MNVFEDLIEELKEENLLEETVIDMTARESAAVDLTSATFQATEDFHSESVVDLAGPSSDEPGEVVVPPFMSSAQAPLDAFVPPNEIQAVPEPGGIQFETPAVAPPEYSSESVESVESVESEPEPTVSLDSSIPAPAMPQLTDQFVPPAKVSVRPPAMPDLSAPPVGRVSFAATPRTSFDASDGRQIVGGREFFKKRAIDEVAGLQMVDHVLSGVEREQMKLVPKPFDDIPVKKALHDFMQFSGDIKSGEHARAEFQLMQETESWYSSLSHRDKHISVAHLRRYCETTKPALSPQALIAMARFYRNSPFSEQVRNKFDLVLTRLFSSEVEDEKRELVFPRDELIAQVKDLYADWSSIQLYSAAEDDSDILISVLKFQDFVTEAEATPTFDELIGNDFFNRLRLFKEGCHENFFAPLITVASIEANIRIGNRYTDLIKREREGKNAAALEEKYGFLHDQAISDSTGKSFSLVEMLKERTDPAKTQIKEVHVDGNFERSRPIVRTPRSRVWAVNKLLLGFAIAIVLACAGLYFWADVKSHELDAAQSTSVKKVNLDNSSLKEVLMNPAKISDETFYGITLESWAGMSLEKKEELLKKILSIGSEKGFKKVHLMNDKGQAVGFAGDEKVEIYNP